MIFHPRQKKNNVIVSLVMENTVIKKVMETKFLGVIVDQHLFWKPHISFIPQITKNCGDYCKSPLLSIIQNVPDLIITFWYIPI